MNLLRRLVFLLIFWIKDHLAPTYCSVTANITPLFLQKSGEIPKQNSASPQSLIELFEHHYFDILGSSFHKWDVNAAPNRVNLANRKKANFLLSLITPGYRRINWHLDPRASYQWKASTWSRLIVPAKPPGVDIKIPWEISRMHHLPLLLLDPSSSADTADEFQNQILDFIATNPPRFGVNWRTPMDVAFRAANWILAHSLCEAQGYRLQQEFTKAFSASLRDHGRYIVEFMEWDPKWRANHYLANICGLVFIAAALPRDSETDNWMSFAIQELIIETQRQINEDGSGFEASTGYHRLSVEMIVYSTAVVLGYIKRNGCSRFEQYHSTTVKFPKPLQSSPLPLHPLPGNSDVTTVFPAEHFQRLLKAADFTKAITKPDGRIALIGDNDSGRFFRLDPKIHNISRQKAIKRYDNLKTDDNNIHEDTYPIEEQLDFTHLVSAISGIVGNKTLSGEQTATTIDSQMVCLLAGGLQAVLSTNEQKTLFCEDSPHSPSSLPHTAKVLNIPTNNNVLLSELHLQVFQDFGLYIFSSPRFFLSVRCGNIGQDGYGGHAHNDQLSVELNIDGKDIIKDPGTYRYTADSLERNAYRSVKAHFVPRASNLEPGNLDIGLWRLGDEAQARVESFDKHHFHGSHIGFDKRVHRKIIIEEKQIIITDWGEDGLEVDDPKILFKQLNKEGCLLPFCPAYGVKHA